ncbi:biotin transporter BioY [Seohaeicola nanhaiensis]|uniref:Biotin transporter n=1 Tax=Seohaeicola nanhaiensis TaxID=1387282 RepID=A0ABV9KHB8_9RHOB
MTHSVSASRSRNPATSVALVVGASLLMTLAAHVSVPFYPVPMTLQGSVAVLAGLLLGPRLALAAMALYLAQGAMGLPVFAGTPARGLGLAYMAGPTGGFLLGFALTAWLAGTLARFGWARSLLGSFIVSLIAIAAMYVPGLLWLGQFTGYGAALLTAGLLPFLIGDAVKAALAALLARGWNSLRR